LRGSEGQTESLLGAILARFVARRAKHVIAVFQAVKNFMISELVGLPRDKIKVIRHGIGTDAYDELQPVPQTFGTDLESPTMKSW